MPNLRQCIIFRAKYHSSASLSVLGEKRGLNAKCTFGDSKSMLLKKINNDVMGLKLFVASLRIAMDLSHVSKRYRIPSLRSIRLGWASKRTFELMTWRSASRPFTASDIFWAAAPSELGFDTTSMMNWGCRLESSEVDTLNASWAFYDLGS